MKLLLKNLLLFLLKPFVPLLARYYEHYSPSIIVLVDGGICSQMRQYLISKVFIDKKIKVEYNLEFFRHGYDMNGLQVRNFDLVKAFPEICIQKASRLKIYVYKKRFSYIGSFPNDDSKIWTSLTPPSIMLGYYLDHPWLYKDLRSVFVVQPKTMDEENQRLYNEIPENSVAIHVRRGDLAVDLGGMYGAPASVQYFLDAINYLNEKLQRPKFYFFSDDTAYVKDNIINRLSGDVFCQLITNGSDKGYCDLFLMSKCSHHITSKGTLGKFGACLNPNNGIVIVAKDELQLGPLTYFSKEIIRF